MTKNRVLSTAEKIEQVKNIYNSNRETAFSELSPLLDAAVLQALYSAKRSSFSARKLASRIKYQDRFAFWQKMFQLRDALPKQEIFNLYLKCLMDRGDIHYQVVSTEHGDETIAANLSDPELLASLPLTDELLIDNPTVLNRYCQVKKPGWETLRYIRGRRAARQNIPEKMRSAIKADQVEKFMICQDMAGKNLSYSLLAEIMQEKAVNIFRALLVNGAVSRVITLDELAVNCTAQYADSISVPLLMTIEEVFPGRLKQVRDHWDRNLLWYAAHNRHTGFFHPFCKLTPLLIEVGCDVENPNQLGIGFRTMFRSLTFYQKDRMMRRRYGTGYLARMAQLDKEQPIYALTDKSFTVPWLEALTA